MQTIDGRMRERVGFATGRLVNSRWQRLKGRYAASDWEASSEERCRRRPAGTLAG